MSCIAVGNFDGVHKGHVKIVNTAAEIAKEKNIPAVVVTFCTNTKKTLGKHVKYLTDNEYKIQLLLDAGADRVEMLEFTPELAGLSGVDFIRLLKEKYGLTHIVCGDNFRFGAKASCGVKELALICASENIGYTVVETNGVSSTVIRGLVESGRVEEANDLLGRDFSYKSDFTGGNHIGRTIGYPTLNQTLMDDYVLPKGGVYATYCADGQTVYPSITNIGSRPTVTEKRDIYVETYILGLKEIPDGKIENFKRIYFFARVRDEKKFDNLGALKAQIATDCRYVTALFDKKERLQS